MLTTDYEQQYVNIQLKERIAANIKPDGVKDAIVTIGARKCILFTGKRASSVRHHPYTKRTTGESQLLGIKTWW